MYSLSLSPQLADKIGLSTNEMEVLQSVKQRADAYLEKNPLGNAAPGVAECIADHHKAEQERLRARDALLARLK